VSRSFIIAILTGLLTGILSATLEARELRVCTDCRYNDLSQVVKEAVSGDVVLVEPGHYKVGTLVIDKPITLKGVKGPVLDGQRQAHIIDIQADGVIIEGLILENSGVSDIREFAGIHGDSIKDCQIRNNILRRATYGIYLARTEGCIVEHNVSNGDAKDEILGGNGIHLWNSNNNTIIDNTITGHRDGIYFEFSEHLLVRNNRALSNLRYGLHFMFCHESTIEKNQFFQNSTGVALMYSKRLNLTQNVFRDSLGPSMQGLLLKDIMDSHITQNYITKNTTGILADNSSRNQIEENLFLQNGRAYEVFGNSQRNSFHRNVVLRNTFDVATNTRDNTNNYEGNYWDRYQGFDLDRDGRGDVAYSPVQIFSFWVSKYPELSLLAGSSMLNFLELMEKVFPVLTPATLKDTSPLMMQPTITVPID